MNIVISLFESAQVTAPERNIDFDAYLSGIEIGAWQDEVLKYRNIKDKAQKDKLKKTLKAVAPSGRFKTRSLEGLEAHSGILCMDLDQKDNPEMRIERLQGDPYVYAYHQSVGGYGYAVYFLIEPTKHAEAFLGLERYLADNYQLICDPSCKDMSRLRFVSFDPNMYKRANKPLVFKLYPKQTKTAKQTVYPHTTNDIDYILNQIINRGIDLTTSYHDWTQIGFAFASEYGEKGRIYFHAVSSVNPQYDEKECDAKYNNFLKTHRGRVSIGTFFFKCKEVGIDLQTEETKLIRKTVKGRMLHGNQTQSQILDSIEKWAEKEGINPEHAKKIALDTFNTPKEELKKEKTDNLLPEIRSALSTYDMKRNEVTGIVEYKGRPLTDWDVNTIWGELANNLGPRCAKSTVEDIINSDATPTYNPFLDFFAKHRDKTPQGCIATLSKCIKTQLEGGSDADAAAYTYTFLRKWLVSIVASMHGTYSLLILVLVGGQGIGKTNFFRWILPEELQEYYGESKLDAGKDDAMLMTSKVILCDDEFSGKSKSEYKHLKDISSKQKFNMRLPYGRRTQDFTRYAVLCGTSNDSEIINDPTGNRRIVPINIKSIDFEAYQSIDKVDLFMEAYHIFHSEGDTSWQLQKHEIEFLNHTSLPNEQVDMAQEAINMFFEKPGTDGIGTETLTTTEIINHIQLNSRLTITAYRIGHAMKFMGFERVSVRKDGKPMKAYVVRKKTTTY